MHKNSNSNKSLISKYIQFSHQNRKFFFQQSITKIKRLHRYIPKTNQRNSQTRVFEFLKTIHDFRLIHKEKICTFLIICRNLIWISNNSE